MQRPQLRTRVGAKFFLAIGVLMAAVLVTAGVGAVGLGRMAQRTDALYNQGLAVSQHTEDVVAATYAIQETSLYQVAIHDQRLNTRLTDELDQLMVPAAQRAIAVLRNDYAGQPDRKRAVDEIGAGLRGYLKLRATGAYVDVPGHPMSDATRTALATRTDRLLEPLVVVGEQLRAAEGKDTSKVKAASDETYRSTRVLLAVSVLLALLLGLAVGLALIRNMVPRIRRYSQFAADVAADHTSAALHLSGDDELTDLGRALNEMTLQREQVAGAERAQAEFVDTLQVTQSEDEAQELLQRHLQRELPGSSVTVLRRNNSANRLEAATAVPAGSPLAGSLVGAEPRSCVSMRLGRVHREGTGPPPLLACALCQGSDRPSTCEPLLVGGEIIGAVLVFQPDTVAAADEGRIRTTVAQAAPVLGNLRSLALAEFRASNDSLTGLPNKRATEDTLKRMVAQASRSVTALSAVMLDLDHFKAVNDRFGHAQGDEVLAAVGSAIQSSIRASDFAGRFGGEEFLILLPDTSVTDAFHVAEKIRNTIGGITIPGVDREITASLGIAGLLEHAGTASSLLREADRAQYAAKAAGRNKTLVASVRTTQELAAQP